MNRNDVSPDVAALNPELFDDSARVTTAVAKRHKYNAQPTEVDGIRFDSKKEAQRYSELKILVCDNQISHLKLQPRYELQPAFVDSQGISHRPITYVADFEYWENGHCATEDTKGFETAVFKIKKKLFLKIYPGIELRIT